MLNIQYPEHYVMNVLCVLPAGLGEDLKYFYRSLFWLYLRLLIFISRKNKMRILIKLRNAKKAGVRNLLRDTLVTAGIQFFAVSNQQILKEYAVLEVVELKYRKY